MAHSLVSRTIDGHNFVGTFIDYQVPLKDKQSDVAGKIDLLSYNKAHNAFYIIELKREDSKEPLLRAILEAYTYYKQVDSDKLKTDFRDLVHHELGSNNRPSAGHDALKANVRAAVLVYAHSLHHNEAEENYALMRLADILGVGVYLLENCPDNETGLMIQKQASGWK